MAFKRNYIVKFWAMLKWTHIRRMIISQQSKMLIFGLNILGEWDYIHSNYPLSSRIITEI